MVEKPIHYLMRRRLRKRYPVVEVWLGPSETPYTEEAEKRTQKEPEPKKFEWFSQRFR